MLILAATPIGNLEDVSQRLKDILASADSVFAEDTRHSRKLLAHLGISRRLRSFHEFSGDGDRNRIAELLKKNHDVVYISDAGMPGISDPGHDLVRLALDLGVDVDVIPGPCAVINALVLSGLPSHAFCFLGFFPTTREKRAAIVEKLVQLQMTAIFFEAPSRIEHTLAFLDEVLNATDIAVCRELTKIHQQVLRGKPRVVGEALKTLKGEFVLVIGPVEIAAEIPDLPGRYQQLLAAGHTPARAIKMLAGEARLPKREVYRLIHIEE